jgi:magnesium chelatase family protein
MPDESRSTPREIQKYLGRISGPLLDRIDIHIEVPAVTFQDLAGAPTGEGSAAIRRRVMAARGVQHKRYARRPRVGCNAHMGARELRHYCKLDEAALELLRSAMTGMNLSARAYDRILRVARTIADLAGAPEVTSEHIAEAIGFRALDRELWT